MRATALSVLPLIAPLIAATVLRPAAAAPSALLLELRIFDGTVEVTEHTRVTVHRAGDRMKPLAQATGAQGPIELQVPEGIYDVQAIEERDGQVVSIQWAHRLVVMPYPDEKGRHLEVLNFKSGFGALQVRAGQGKVPEVNLQSGERRERSAGVPLEGPGYTLFVVPAGVYDLTVKRDGRVTRHTNIEVPRDRTRLWIVPDTNESRIQTRRPVSRRRTMTTSATTSRTWINPPTTSSANPSSHSTSRMTTMVHNMDLSFPRTDAMLPRSGAAAIAVPAGV